MSCKDDVHRAFTWGLYLKAVEGVVSSGLVRAIRILQSAYQNTCILLPVYLVAVTNTSLQVLLECSLIIPKPAKLKTIVR